MLLAQDLNLKIADFGLSGPIQGRDGSGILRTREVGTEGYRGPEIHETKGYKGEPNDIFAAGVILFILVTRLQPFVGDAKWNEDYLLLQSDSKKYWTERAKSTSTLSNEVKCLIE